MRKEDRLSWTCPTGFLEARLTGPEGWAPPSFPSSAVALDSAYTCSPAIALHPAGEVRSARGPGGTGSRLYQTELSCVSGFTLRPSPPPTPQRGHC